MKNSNYSSWGSLRQLGARLHRPSVELPKRHRVGLVDRLFGQMTHFCFVVELDGKGARERRRS